MTRHLTAALALSAGLALAACGTTTSHPAAAHSSAVSAPNPAAASPSAARHHHHHHRAQAAARRSACETGLWRHIYHPDRLKVVKLCMTVRGTVEEVRSEPDGDKHVLLATRASLVNSANDAYQHGDLLLEEICQGPVTQADAVEACKGVPQMIIPSAGDKVVVTGSYVLDQDHGWMEIHPVTNIRITGQSAIPAAPATSAAAPPPAPSGCYPKTPSGNCYEPGEFCSSAEHGETGVAGDGKSITCAQDGSDWRWS